MPPDSIARFFIGQLVEHRLFGYRGVIYDVDPVYSAPEEWYEKVARTRPPKDRPWYHVLVDGRRHVTYVAERNLAPSEDDAEISHPGVPVVFEKFEGGAYVPKQRSS